MNIKFTISDEMFGGFSTTISINELKNQNENLSMDMIVNEAVKNLYDFFMFHDMIQLASMVGKKKWHIHDVNIEDILNENCRDEYYICSHVDANDVDDIEGIVDV